MQKILGHEQIEQQLARTIQAGKVYPTWIFCGPAGIGKSMMAHKFAKCLLAEKIPTTDTLNLSEDHPIQRAVDTLTHPDFFVLDQTSISIEDTRKLMANLHNKPAQSKWRVVILENAENLNKNICNSLLKILEEPPKNAAIILICANLGNMPKTLLSRACTMNFHSLPKSVVQNFLENRGFFEDADRLAEISCGSIGYALKLAENDGLNIYERLLAAINGNAENSNETMKYIITKNVCANFDIVKNSLMHILKNYMDDIVKRAGNSGSKKIDVLAKKILEINLLLEKCNFLQLDKNAVVASVFEKFHEQ